MDRYRNGGPSSLGRCSLCQSGVVPTAGARGYQYAIRIPANDVLEREIAHLLRRPVGRPPRKPIVLYAGFLYARRAGMYSAASWRRSSGIRTSCSRVSASS